MQKTRIFITRLVPSTFALGFLVTIGCLVAGAETADEGEAFFEKRIRPILVNHCYRCHADLKSEGGLLLDTRQGWQKGGENGAAIVPGKAEDSLLIKAVRYQDEILRMPPEDAGGKLSDEEIATLEEWVRRGAPDPRTAAQKLGGMNVQEAGTWWAFQPLPKADTLPAEAQQHSQALSEKIDGLLNRRLAEHTASPVAHADKRTLIRRATYDLTGLPPTPDDVDAFLADDAPDAFTRVVDRLLDSPHYGVRWGRHWLDVVRYADTAGENTDRPLPHAWRYRNWVFESFNQDKPFDEFLRLQVAGDLIHKSESRERLNEGIIATGYLAIARRYGHDIDQHEYLMHEDVIDNLGKNLLGLTIGCSRCHDHKYDPITMDDYYALYGIFQSTRFAFPGCEPKGQPRDLVPLLSEAEIDSRMKPWSEQVAIVEAIKKEQEMLMAALRELRVESSRSLTKTATADGAFEFANPSEEIKQSGGFHYAGFTPVVVGEGATVPINNPKIRLRRGEVLQLTVFPNANHGADTTRLEWKIEEAGGQGRIWDLDDTISRIPHENPLTGADGATWCFFESTVGPQFLGNRHESLEKQPALKAWKRSDDALSVFANTADQPIKVWTTLPAKAFFVHPEHNRPVTVAFVSPIDGEVRLSGAVTDAHPSGLDGVSFELAHVASSRYGDMLIDLGSNASMLVGTDIPEKPSIPVAYAVVEGKPVNTQFQYRGDPEQLGDVVPRHWLSVFGGETLSNPEESGRRELADWIAAHPLTARVMVNRIWQWHFGRGLVATPNNFGTRGAAPSHPELLDWLAAEFAAGGYRLKNLHRAIMQTAAYQRSSEQPQVWLEADPENRLLGRFNRRRLSAEEIRDSLLQVSTRLDPTPAEAHPFPEESTWNFTQHDPFHAVYETDKRSAYLMVQRQRRHPFLALFDGADPNASTPSRQNSTVPTQALYFLNDPFFHAQAAALADQLFKLPDQDQRIQQAYRIVLQRDAAETERTIAATFLQQYPAEAVEKWRAYVRVLLAGNEFIHVD